MMISMVSLDAYNKKFAVNRVGGFGGGACFDAMKGREGNGRVARERNITTWVKA